MAVGSRSAPLSASGYIAAAIVGVAAKVGGWRYLALLFAYFFAAIALSRFRRQSKERASAGVIEKSGSRDATQVIANGGIFAASVVLSLFGNTIFHQAMGGAALGALAASSADTWATEIGILAGGAPLSLRNLHRVQPGTSGAVSIAGLFAMIAGSAFVAFVSAWSSLAARPWIIVIAGMSGAVADTLLGATLQAQRHCSLCNARTEQHEHTCGASTDLVSGFAWMDNDLVNLLATFVGAVVAAALVTF